MTHAGGVTPQHLGLRLSGRAEAKLFMSQVPKGLKAHSVSPTPSSEGISMALAIKRSLKDHGAGVSDRSEAVKVRGGFERTLQPLRGFVTESTERSHFLALARWTELMALSGQLASAAASVGASKMEGWPVNRRRRVTCRVTSPRPDLHDFVAVLQFLFLLSALVPGSAGS